MLFIFNGCATVPKETNSEESLRAKAMEYWKLRMQEKYEDTYRMEDPGGLLPFDKYRDLVRTLKTNFMIESHSIGDIKVEGEEAAVDVKIAFRMTKSPALFRDVIHDRWAFRDGKWLHILPKP